MTRSYSSDGSGHGVWRKSWLMNFHFISLSGLTASAAMFALPGARGAISMPVNDMLACPLLLKYRWHIMLQKPDPQPTSSTLNGGFAVSEGEHTGPPKTCIKSKVRKDWR